MKTQAFSQVEQNSGDASVQPGILIIGLGNPILGDDGVGWKIAVEVERQLHFNENGAVQEINPATVQVEYLSLGGLSLMENMIGFENVILVDAIVTHKQPVGSIIRLRLEDLPHQTANHLASAHDVSLQNAVEMGRKLGASLPSNIFIVAIESRQVYDFSDQLSPQVEAGIPAAVEAVFECLQEITSIPPQEKDCSKISNKQEILP